MYYYPLFSTPKFHYLVDRKMNSITSVDIFWHLLLNTSELDSSSLRLQYIHYSTLHIHGVKYH